GDDLVATLAIDVSDSGGKVTGKTPHPYPTGIGGAVEMTSEIMVTKESFEVADRGFGADGKQVWGPAAGTFTEFKHADLGLKVVKGEEGLVSITYPSKLEGKPAAKDEQVSCEYVGYLMDGKICDSSYERQRPLVFPQGTQLLKGWNMQMDGDTQKGLQRRLVIPPQFGYGAAGRRGRIPANATLIYDIEITNVAPPLPPPPAAEAAPTKEMPKEEMKDQSGDAHSPH
ncbi:MAG: CpcT/CpeT family chromophore lyase, partial [Phycisphaerales bacterium]